jgi:hypothetical protein
MRKMAVLAAVVALAGAGGAAAATGPAGTFAATIQGSPLPRFDGVWTITLAAGGKYTIALGRQPLIRGTATFNGSRITFDRESGPAACLGAAARGVYSWRLTGKSLRFTRLADACLGRRVVLSYPFTRTG